jgi:hypothetical protein
MAPGALLEGLRHAGDADRSFRQSQVDAAVRFCAKVFGREYAALLGKAAGSCRHWRHQGGPRIKAVFAAVRLCDKAHCCHDQT